MTKKRKIELLEMRIHQLEEENDLLLKNSSEGLTNTIKKANEIIEKYNKLTSELQEKLDDVKKLNNIVNDKKIKERIKFLKNMNKKISKI